MGTRVFSKFRNIVVLLCVLCASSSLHAQLPRTSSIVKSYGRLVVPNTGIYWGAEDDGNNFTTGPNGIEFVLGRTMAIRRKAYNWDNGPKASPTSFEFHNAALTDPHVISMVCQHTGSDFPVKFTTPRTGFSSGGDWSSTNTIAGASGKTGIDRITAGEWDAQFTSQFNGLKALAGPVIYNLFYEFNGQGQAYFSEAQGAAAKTLWSPGTGEIAYRDAYRHIRGLADACDASINHGGNVIFVWCAAGTTAEGYFQNYYPGDDYVDFIGIDLYRRTFATGTNNATPILGSGDDLIYKFAEGTQAGSSAVERFNSVKPMIVCEAGYDNGVDYPDSGTDGDGRNYRKDSDLATAPLNIEAKLLDDLKNRYPDVIAYVTWNVSDSNHFNVVDQSAASRARYKTLANDPYCGLFYDAPAHLANISTRMRVGSGDEALIGGFIVQGAQIQESRPARHRAFSNTIGSDGRSRKPDPGVA